MNRAQTRWPQLVEREPLPSMSMAERDRLIQMVCAVAAEQLKFSFPGISVPRDHQQPLPASSRAHIRRLAREWRQGVDGGP